MVSCNQFLLEVHLVSVFPGGRDAIYESSKLLVQAITGKASRLLMRKNDVGGDKTGCDNPPVASQFSWSTD